MSDPSCGVSIHIAARNHADARALFEKSMELLADGADFNGQMIRGDPDGGVVQLYTHQPRQKVFDG